MPAAAAEAEAEAEVEDSRPPAGLATDTGGQWKLPSTGEAVTLAGPLTEITAYLTGRANRLTTAGGEAAPVLPWL